MTEALTEALTVDPVLGGLLAVVVVVLGIFGVAALRRRAPRPDQRPAEPRPDTQPLQEEAGREVERHESHLTEIDEARDNATGADPDKPSPADLWNR